MTTATADGSKARPGEVIAPMPTWPKCPVLSAVSSSFAWFRLASAMLKGEQYSTIFKDTRELAKVTANMVDAMLSGKQPEINDTKTYNNGVKVVPSYLLKPVAVDASNWHKVLIDSGYYKESQIK